MRKELFDELVESVKEGMAILRGEMEPSRIFVVEEKPDVKTIRTKFGISQSEFASLLGISVRILKTGNKDTEHRKDLPGFF